MGRRKIEGVQRMPSGKYRVRAEYRDPKTGKRAEIDRLVKAKDAAEAASIREKLLAERLAARGERKALDRTRVRDALALWLKSKRLTIRESTAEKYQYAVDRWTGSLGEYFLDRLDPDDVRAVMAGWRDVEIATETINSRLRALRTFAKDMRVSHIVDGVRALEETVEESEADEEEGRGLSAEELRALLAHGPTAPMRVKNKRGRLPKVLPKWWPRAWALVATLAWTGLRFGEASALRWEDVDLDAGILRVRRAQWRGIVGHPKARASKRRVVLAPDLVATLHIHRDAMLRGQLMGVESALVFPSRRKAAEFVSNTHARKSMLTACAAAGIDLGDRPALHCLRHSFNNLVRQVSSEEVRRSIIGHAEEVETYTNVKEHEQRAAIGAVVRLVKGGE